MFYSAEVKICPLKTFKKHQCGDVVSSKDLDLRGKLKYVTFGRFTIAPKNSTRVGLAGSTSKCSITLTLAVTLDGKILLFKINILLQISDAFLPRKQKG